MKKKGEFKRFSNLLDKVLNVSHQELKDKLDEEKQGKKRKKSKKSSASREAI